MSEPKTLTLEDTIGNAIPSYVLLGCCPSIDIHYDQWAVCVLDCSHGKYTGISDRLNLTQAYHRAVEKMMVDHPRCAIEFEDTFVDFLTQKVVVEKVTCDYISGHNSKHESFC